MFNVLKPGVGEYTVLHASPAVNNSAFLIPAFLVYSTSLPFTHFFLFKKEEPPACIACNTTITVIHILIECADLLEVRSRSGELRTQKLKSHLLTTQSSKVPHLKLK